jgi:hypothetical protein
MPRHLISDSHERINEIPTVPIYFPAKLQARERAGFRQNGKKTLLRLTLVSFCTAAQAE